MTDRENVLRSTKIISLAITAGPTIFLGVVLFLVNRAGSEMGTGETSPMLSYVSIFLAVGAMGVFAVLPRIVRKQHEDPLKSFQVMVVIRSAVLEAPALMGCVAYLLEGQDMPIGAGVAIAAIMILAGSTPTESKLDAWVDGP